MDGDFVRKQFVRQNSAKRVHTPPGSQDSERRAGQGKQNRLRQKLADEPSAAGSQGSSHRELVLPRGAPREQQDRSVGAADDQQQHSCGKQTGNGASRTPYVAAQSDNSNARVLPIEI